MIHAFGHKPSGEELKRIEQSPRYRGGSFQNEHDTPQLAEGANIITVMRHALKKNPAKTPPFLLPSVKRRLPERCDAFTLTWFGHSAYLVQVNQLNILVDPVFGERPSFSKNLGPKAFPGSRAYDVKDLPPIDILIQTHDHYDHLEYPTILQLKNKVKHWYAPLGVASHLVYWGVPEAAITSLDWWQTTALPGNMQLTATPARHFSGRGLVRNKTLWTSFVLQTPNEKVFLGGDSGYDTHFAAIGEQFGPFDLAILECGQYDAFWPYIHMMPEQTAQAAVDLNAKWLLPVHWAKYALAAHAWDDSIKRVTAAAANLPLQLTTPLIGEELVLNRHMPQKQWWKEILPH
ncbi:MBL fold metallo-hydrolase [Deminuibacter soli]|uniref:MBL fold metallo-hydrolase n=1 Tax=Deminuibacter soli TaxID=2291815 RepID=A0A3E1NQC9_9BACT|nr:MBL fold metallo-hydrolase [Deminuibacter soli]RFM30132.1 MBL fold metallo-hydrolase [Deminuibacter soli]